MSSWSPPETEQKQSSHDPGIKEREITSEREFTEPLYGFSGTDFVILGLFMSMPTGILTFFLLLELFPEYQDTAGHIVRTVADIVTHLLLTLPW